jgi:hypothetical protein
MGELVLKGQGSPWYPNSINQLERHLEQLFRPIAGISRERCKGIRKNVAYTLQYLEFTVQIVSDLELSGVLAKSFVLHGCAVIEAVFFYVLTESGHAAQKQWASQAKTTSSEFTLGGKTYRTEMEIFIKLSKPELETMTFDAMCKRVEKRDLIKLSNDFYSKLPYLRGLRNRIHLHTTEDHADTDYMKFEHRGSIPFTRSKSFIIKKLS